MPQLIHHIDLIARCKGRDVLYLDFRNAFPRDRRNAVAIPLSEEWDDIPVRRQIIAWLEQEGIAWRPCADMARMDDGQTYYSGQIYLDVAFDTADPTYQKLGSYLENPDGTSRIEGVIFAYLPLVKAMENAHHDEPGFWESRDE